ncbi:hypothetical protein K2173_005074 [Erythroxylum novogranatense]|uniref:NAC domain-containing protein n=1 Tax=Erythroxylum novogranatense TaxID=1862640 RepID=A0AAV8UCC2_9ROSI|nr:hypothetical protein K2173_005074 [Erythroxylum novogranatense]
MEEQLVGFRFHPTDEEIINHYLKLKMDGDDSQVANVIGEIELARVEPWELPGLSRLQSNDQVWYFFYRLDYKYSNSKRANRSTKSGFWKATGKIRHVKAKDTGEDIGTKRTLVFYRKEGRDSKPVKTDWIIHEYQAKTRLPNQTEYFVCKLKNKAEVQTDVSVSPCEEGEPSSSVAFGFDNEAGHYANLEGISTDYIGATIDCFSNDPQVYNSEDDLDPEKLADSFLVDPGPDAVGTYKYQHHTRGVAECEGPSQRRIQPQGKTAPKMPEKPQGPQRVNTAFGFSKESSVVDSKQYRRLVGGAPVTALTRSKRLVSNERKDILIRFETLVSGHEPSPPSVYIVNILVALVLFIIILWEMFPF